MLILVMLTLPYTFSYVLSLRRWNESRSSSPAIAMRAAQDLYSSVLIDLEQRRIEKLSSNPMVDTTKNFVSSSSGQVNDLFAARSLFLTERILQPLDANNDIVNQLGNRYSSIFDIEPDFTNWNGDFRG